ncbi:MULTISPECIES: PHB depolymerase family esterase [Glaesserella]|uniref:Pyrroline-5-carboxylate reductase n=1 Tax=Glaesserella australis TaxID=2094024 RepID=A0A328BZK0_9PAST|nr:MULTISPECIES: PHB depolymerase family esterase [Glaesserella]AUI65990.1 pyrroline-5-carboxylate reductase [Glaesserella sp. 15-184]RAL18290.1 pyrroline-5-carboxylate reductase [Glaesserella australis]
MKLTKLSALLTFVFSGSALAGIVDATAVSQPTGEGQQVNHVLLKYDQPQTKVQADKFSVNGRTVLKATSVVECAEKTVPYCDSPKSDLVLLTLEPADSGFVTAHVGREPSFERDVVLEVSDNRKAKAEKVTTSKLRQLVAENFTQHVFTDEATGIKVLYNLYVPKNYDPKKSYPLVMFIHDAGSTNSNVKNTLYQGNGAAVWAMPEFQARHEAFVLAPQFDHTITNDQSDDPADLDPTINLIKSLSKAYNIDQNRLYTTGQSGGAMMSIAMNIKYPDFFAASYIVAGQWEPTKTAPMAKNKLFILVSEKDPKAFPTEKEIVKVLAANGGVVKESFGWNGEASIDELNENVKALLAQGGNIHFATFAGGSLKHEKLRSDMPAIAHMATWKVAYNITAIQDWLFSQRK